MLCLGDPSKMHAKLRMFLILHCSFLAICFNGYCEILRYMSLFQVILHFIKEYE